jgi:LytS/YehU family sensor histidine kinase
LTDRKIVPASNLTSIRVFAAFVTVVAACAITLSLATSGPARWQVLLVLAAAAWIAESRGMPLNSIELSVSFIPIVLAAVLFGPAAGGLVGLAGMLGDRRGPIERFSIYASTRAIAGVVGGTVALAVEHTIGRATLLEVLAARWWPASATSPSTCSRQWLSGTCAVTSRPARSGSSCAPRRR